MADTHPFARLLVPLDGSGLAEAVLPAVEALAARFGATVTLLHVLERNPPGTIHGEKHLAETDEAEAYIARVAERLTARGISVESHIHDARERDVAGSIIAHAAEYEQELVVLASHGSGGLRNVLVGSIAEQVLQRGAQPILLVRPERGASAEFAPRTILAPVHDAHAQEASLCAATTLGRVFDARVHLVWVVATAATLSGDEAPTATMLPGTMRALLEMRTREAETTLAGMADGCRAEGVEVVSRVARGEAVRAVSHYARDVQPDLIVLSSHGRSGLGALLEGSFAHRLAQRVDCPLLLLRVP